MDSETIALITQRSEVQILPPQLSQLPASTAPQQLPVTPSKSRTSAFGTILGSIGRQTHFQVDGDWVPVLDGNHTARSIFDCHYSRYFYADGRKPKLFVGPGEKMVLVSPDALALFAWRKFKSADGQQGINCAIFRNEGLRRSSSLIQSAEILATARWGSQRFFTYVNARRLSIRKKRGAEYCPFPPGRCFIEAGWRFIGFTKARRLHIFEKPALEVSA